MFRSGCHEPFGPHVRSLLCLFRYQFNSLPSVASFLYNGLKLLNVLDFESIELASVPSGITHLILLKYLAVRGPFKSMPSSIGRLWNLETLVVRAPLTCLPDAILCMVKLKHLLVDSKKATLASLYEHEALNLHTVQTLCTVCITSHSDMKVLRYFQNLREIKCFFSAIETGFVYRLDIFSQLEILHISLKTSAQRSPLSFPPSLKELTLSKFGVPWKVMSVLAKRLPKLEVLRLVENAIQGKEWDMDIDEVEFPELKFLKLRGLGIHKWNLSCAADVFPKLERLVVKYCKNMEKIRFSFAENTKLCLVELEGCSTSVEDSAFEIKEGQHEYGNEKFEVLIRLADENRYRNSTYNWY